MARKKVIDLNADSMIDWEKPGQQLNGYYIGAKTVQSEYGPSKLHVFQTEDGTVGCWGSAQLDAKLATIEKGCATYVTFGGKTKIKGGKTMKNFDVEFDDEDKQDFGNTTVNLNKDASEDDESEEQEETSEEESEETQDVDPEESNADEDESEVEQNPAKEVMSKKGASVAPTADQKAKANAVLAKLQDKKFGKTAA